MNEELLRDVAYIQGQCACAIVEALGMIAENMQRQQQGLSMAYTKDAFDNLMAEYSISHNAVIGLLNNSR